MLNLIFIDNVYMLVRMMILNSSTVLRNWLFQKMEVVINILLEEDL